MRYTALLLSALVVAMAAAPAQAALPNAADQASVTACNALDVDKASMRTAARLLDKSTTLGAHEVADNLRRGAKRSSAQRSNVALTAYGWCQQNVLTPATTVAPRPTVPSTTAAPGFAGTGTYVVGQTVQPGVYVSAGNSLCYWERSSDASGSLDAIIENDNAVGQALVQLNPGEVFKTNRCGRWTIYQAPSQPLATFGDGTWVVPSQVPPGRWQSSGGSGCYWQRSANLAGDIHSINANDNVEGPTVVDIQPGDAAFVSKRCGTWTRVG